MRYVSASLSDVECQGFGRGHPVCKGSVGAALRMANHDKTPVPPIGARLPRTAPPTPANPRHHSPHLDLPRGQWSGGGAPPESLRSEVKRHSSELWCPPRPCGRGMVLGEGGLDRGPPCVQADGRTCGGKQGTGMAGRLTQCAPPPLSCGDAQVPNSFDARGGEGRGVSVATAYACTRVCE